MQFGLDERRKTAKEDLFDARPHPGLLPRGEGSALARLDFSVDERRKRRKKVSVDARPHPGLLPLGEGTALARLSFFG